MLQLKVCGMRDENNLSHLIDLQPNFIGLIFHEKSPRNIFEPIEIDIPENIILTGVFVEESESFIMQKVREYGLKAIQLHGYESPSFCEKLKDKKLIIIKAFNIHEAFDFSTTEPYNGLCDYFLFDAFGKKVLSSTENKEEVLQIGISLNDLKIKRRKLNFLQDGDDFKLL